MQMGNVAGGPLLVVSGAVSLPALAGATVLIETILAAFEMEEILFALKDHSAGLNAGRWDYLFSIIKKFQDDPTFLFPDRAELTMKTPFMRAYTRLLTQTCHARGAQPIGGMAAFIPRILHVSIWHKTASANIH